MRRRAFDTRPAFVIALSATGMLAAAALVAASVRVLPWLLDPTLPAELARPFARSLVTLALEAAILTGWPVGWAIASQRLASRGEARVLRLLGESPTQTMRRLVPQGLVFCGALFLVSYLGGVEAGAPGRVVNELIGQGRAACAEARAPVSFTVPFANAAWLCGTEDGPHLFGRAPGGLSNASFTASRAEVSGDLRRIDLQNARIYSGAFRVDVGSMRIRGLIPFAHASGLPPALRAFVVAASAALSAWLAGASMLVASTRGGWGRVHAAVVGVVGPLVTLFTLRVLEQRLPDEPRASDLVLFALIPIAAALSVFACARALAGIRAIRKLAPDASD